MALTPLLALCVVLVLALLLRAWRLGYRTALNLPAVWTLMEWLLLFAYPTLCGKALGFFDCFELERGDRRVYADLTLRCYDGWWWQWLPLSVLSLLVYALGIPATFYCLAKHWHRSLEADNRVRVALLTRSYRPELWFWESVDLIRKLLLTAVVLVVAPKSVLQLLFGTIVTLLACLLYLRLLPYQDAICNAVQSASLVAQVITYICAILFFRDEYSGGHLYSDVGDAALDVALIAFCSLGTLTIVLAVVVSVLANVSAREEILLFERTGARVELPLPDGCHFHLYVSHAWRSGEQAALVAQGLRLLVPSSEVFVDAACLEVPPSSLSRTAACPQPPLSRTTAVPQPHHSRTSSSQPARTPPPPLSLSSRRPPLPSTSTSLAPPPCSSSSPPSASPPPLSGASSRLQSRASSPSSSCGNPTNAMAAPPSVRWAGSRRRVLSHATLGPPVTNLSPAASSTPALALLLINVCSLPPLFIRSCSRSVPSGTARTFSRGERPFRGIAPPNSVSSLSAPSPTSS